MLTVWAIPLEERNEGTAVQFREDVSKQKHLMATSYTTRTVNMPKQVRSILISPT